MKLGVKLSIYDTTYLFVMFNLTFSLIIKCTFEYDANLKNDIPIIAKLHNENVKANERVNMQPFYRELLSSINAYNIKLIMQSASLYCYACMVCFARCVPIHVCIIPMTKMSRKAKQAVYKGEIYISSNTCRIQKQ